jgi:DNA-binding GntR family transcriptional regulator
VTGALDSLPMIGPARRRVLSDEVADAIRDAIFDGRIDLGQRLVEDELASLLNVSRGPVRRALVLLSEEGLVNTEHHRGTTVAELSADDVRETASLRTALERLAVDWLCRNATEGDFTRIAVVLQQVGDLAGPLSPSRVAALDVAFHDAVFRAAHHERLYRSWRSLRSQIYIDLVYRRALRDDVGQWVIDHQKFLEVLRHRNQRDVMELVEAHVEGPHGPTGPSSPASA